MKLKLIRAARIRHEAGEIVEVSPAESGFLLSTGSAVSAEAAPARHKRRSSSFMTVIRSKKK